MAKNKWIKKTDFEEGLYTADMEADEAAMALLRGGAVSWWKEENDAPKHQRLYLTNAQSLAYRGIYGERGNYHKADGSSLSNRTVDAIFIRSGEYYDIAAKAVMNAPAPVEGGCAWKVDN
jgi:hypothetical protein